MFAEVENNIVQKVLSELPKTHSFTDGRSTGNFDMLDSDTHMSEGFFLLEENKPVFNAEYQYLAVGDYTILADKVIRNWIVITHDIVELKTEKKMQVNALREEKIQSGFLFNGVLFDSDEASLRNITAMAASIALGESIPSGFSWRAADNTDVVMSEADIRQFSLAARDYIYQIHLVARQHKAAIDALILESGVVSYDIYLGW